MRRCLVGGILLKESPGAILREPRRGVVAFWQQLKEIAYVRVGSGIVLQNGIVDIPRILMPGVEDDLLIGLVRMQRGHNPFDWVVTQDGTDSDLHPELELMSLGELREEGFVLANGLALVVVN